jgi:hypothetical protein
MGGETLGGWMFFVFWMVPNVVAAVAAWSMTEPPQNRGWEAIKAFFGMSALIVIFGIVHTAFWLFVIAWPFMWAFNKVDRHFGGDGIREFGT